MLSQTYLLKAMHIYFLIVSMNQEHSPLNPMQSSSQGVGQDVVSSDTPLKKNLLLIPCRLSAKSIFLWLLKIPPPPFFWLAFGWSMLSVTRDHSQFLFMVDSQHDHFLSQSNQRRVRDSGKMSATVVCNLIHNHGDMSR